MQILFATSYDWTMHNIFIMHIITITIILCNVSRGQMQKEYFFQNQNNMLQEAEKQSSSPVW